MAYTMEDFTRDFMKKHYPELTAEEQRELLEQLPVKRRRQLLKLLPTEERREVIDSLPPEERLAGLSAEQIRRYLNELTTRRPAELRKPRRKRRPGADGVSVDLKSGRGDYHGLASRAVQALARQRNTLCTLPSNTSRP
jgi:hypothetical protein